MSAYNRLNRMSLLAGSVIFAALFYYIGPSEVFRALRSTHFAYLPLTLAAFSAGAVVRIHKWSIMCRRMDAGMPASELRGLYFASKFWGMVSPMRSGEALPALISPERRGSLLSVVFYDRVVESFQTLIVFGGLFFWFYGTFFEARSGIALAGVFGVLTLGMFVMFNRRMGGAAFSALDRILGALGGGPFVSRLKRISDVLKKDMEDFYRATASYFSVGFGVWMLALTFIGWVFDLALWFVIFRAVGADIPLVVVTASVVIYSMVGAMAPIPGGLGASDLSLAVILGRFGYTAEAGGIIVIVRILVFTFNYLGYALFHGTAGMRNPEVNSERG